MSLEKRKNYEWDIKSIVKRFMSAEQLLVIDIYDPQWGSEDNFTTLFGSRVVMHQSDMNYK